ncbi:hypothetical protein ASF62_01055 [Leifsonia sp. Leaf325]|nr:hypothetical protein [Leifsonia sp. Leaf325]KQQ95166.1 hypothetical protein ASF62_01055 [Leifsonia sp. Leaf325]
MPPIAAGWYEVDTAIWWWDGARWSHDEGYRALGAAATDVAPPVGERVQITGAIEPLPKKNR